MAAVPQTGLYMGKLSREKKKKQNYTWPSNLCNNSIMTLAVWPSMGLPLSFRCFFKELSCLGGMTEDKQLCHLSPEEETLAIESSVQLNRYHRAVPVDGFSSSHFSEAGHFPWRGS